MSPKEEKPKPQLGLGKANDSDNIAKCRESLLGGWPWPERAPPTGARALRGAPAFLGASALPGVLALPGSPALPVVLDQANAPELSTTSANAARRQCKAQRRMNY